VFQYVCNRKTVLFYRYGMATEHFNAGKPNMNRYVYAKVFHMI